MKIPEILSVTLGIPILIMIATVAVITFIVWVCITLLAALCGSESAQERIYPILRTLPRSMSGIPYS